MRQMPRATAGSGNLKSEIAEQWHSLMIRKALVTDQSLCLNFEFPNSTVRFGELRQATATLVYISAVSILDDACKVRVADQQLKPRRDDLYHRMLVLDEVNDLLEYETLNQIRDRRNDFGHKPEESCSLEELETALKEIEQQLIGWRFAEGTSTYELTATRSEMRGSDDPDVAFEQDMTVRILRNKKMTWEVCQTRKFHKVSKKQ